jgi:hypothetical protein
MTKKVQNSTKTRKNLLLQEKILNILHVPMFPILGPKKKFQKKIMSGCVLLLVPLCHGGVIFKIAETSPCTPCAALFSNLISVSSSGELKINS